STTAVPMLRLKARLGDADAEVLSECFGSLMQLGAADAVPFVAEFLAAPATPVRAAAVLALGESRRPEAPAHLTQFWHSGHADEVVEETLLAFALLRLPAATHFLIELIGNDPAHAIAAVRSLAVLRHDREVRQRTADAVARAGGTSLRRVFDERFRE